MDYDVNKFTKLVIYQIINVDLYNSYMTWNWLSIILNKNELKTG